jgi:putative membrane protein
MWSYHYYNDSFLWPFGAFSVIAFWVILIILIISIFSKSSKNKPQEPGQGPKKADEAMDILRKRYAAGEINQEEFNQKKKDLEG